MKEKLTIWYRMVVSMLKSLLFWLEKKNDEANLWFGIDTSDDKDH